jgi:protein SCO1/2
MKKIIFILISFLLYSCSSNNKTYKVTGVVLDINEGDQTIIVDHDSIKGFMMPMVMPFKYRDRLVISNLSKGDSVKFKLIITDQSSYVDNFTVLGNKELIDDYDEFWDDDEFKEKKIGESISDVTLINLNQELVKISSINQKYIFISFIFTRCPIPNMCPAVVIKNGYLAKEFRYNDKISFVMVSFDYIYDTPNILNEFYGEIVNDFNNWEVLSSAENISNLYTLSSELGCEFWGIEENNIGHNLRSALIGPEMKLLKVWEGDDWIAGDVKKYIESYLKIGN